MVSKFNHNHFGNNIGIYVHITAKCKITSKIIVDHNYEFWCITYNRGYKIIII